MSLKAVHIAFICASILLAIGFALWEIFVFRDSQRPLDLLFAGIGLLTGVLLVLYGRYVLRKLKDISYL